MANELNTQRGGLHAYQLRVPAGKSTKRDIRGCTIRVADSPHPVEITVHNKKLNGGKGTAFSLEMKKFEKWFTDIEYDAIEVRNDGVSDIFVTLQLGYGDFVAEIISRTLAASSIVCDGEDGYVDDTTEPRDPMLVEIPENLQRKRIKIRIFVKTTNGTNVTGAPDVWWFYKHENIVPASIDDVDVYPLGQILELPEGVTQGGLLLQSDGHFDIELETTSAIYVGALLVGGTYDEYEIDYAVRWIEEVYSAA